MWPLRILLQRAAFHTDREHMYRSDASGTEHDVWGRLYSLPAISILAAGDKARLLSHAAAAGSGDPQDGLLRRQVNRRTLSVKSKRIHTPIGVLINYVENMWKAKVKQKHVLMAMIPKDIFTWMVTYVYCVLKFRKQTYLTICENNFLIKIC